jgi:trans-aconitate methyltransferase
MRDVSFKWDAGLYQKSSSHQFNLGLMAIKKLNPKDGEHILEIGSGNGMVTIELAKKIPNGKITAIEISKEMCTQAEENIRKSEMSNIKINCKDGIEIDFQNQFDAVFSNSAIHWIQNLELMYELIYNSLKKNGRILMQTGMKEVSPIWLIFAKLVTRKPYREYISNLTMPWRFLTVRENQTILEHCKFKNILVEPFEYVLKFPDKGSVLNYWKAAGLVPFLSILPEELKGGFIEKFKDIYFKKMAESPLEFKMTRLFVSATK